MNKLIDDVDTCQIIEPFDLNVKIPISEFFCHKICDNVCTSLSDKIANSLIMAASSKIFDEPTKSFNEIVVNGLDAIAIKNGIQSKVGKFKAIQKSSLSSLHDPKFRNN